MFQLAAPEDAEFPVIRRTVKPVGIGLFLGIGQTKMEAQFPFIRRDFLGRVGIGLLQKLRGGGLELRDLGAGQVFHPHEVGWCAAFKIIFDLGRLDLWTGQLRRNQETRDRVFAGKQGPTHLALQIRAEPIGGAVEKMRFPQFAVLRNEICLGSGVHQAKRLIRQ